MRDKGIWALLVASPFLGLWLFFSWLGMHAGCVTFHATPDVENLQQFATHSGNESKFFFLFGPSLIFLVFGFVLLSVSTAWLDSHPRFPIKSLNTFVARAIILSLASVFVWLVADQHAREAMQATAATGWHGTSKPNAVVDTACRLF